VARIPANHFTVKGKGIEGTIDTAGLAGSPVVDLRVDGAVVDNAELDISDMGIEVNGFVEAVPDMKTVLVRLTVPQCNVEDHQTTEFSGFAVVVTSRTSIGGPPLVGGPLQTYDVRAVTGTASVVESLT
jgi:hypothetical protein